ncbi:T9SS type A sorting domain-containing protein [Flavobacterium sp. F-380]|uniref:T9SS type A sorting domain-containing protein n=1 Tax=Flavobacterium kayseriense TaxID=2764714 RepID=A0ABR7J7L1_9FLAO|nr:LamG-like jellyroll fold domain-containing protein [Flavobacterium kayseriense]MBC5841314.1 T9SS type A sorting domain-containing protein [Flavobacterium kayseriense]MBC5847842.1 T9SS type A sorting domain-containing protein [Flavobacterium kayseriense]
MDKTLHVNNLICKIAVQIILILFVLNPLKTIAQATVVKPFTQRAAAATPTQLNYRIKGDFTMIGNTNLTLAAYGDAVNNNTENMIFVDVDSDPSTFNSSSAELQLSNENGALPNCSRILYAGLYWTGRSNSSQYTFNVTKNGVTKPFDKRKVSIKGPNETAYTVMTATNSDIQYPVNLSTHSGIFVGYKEITDYVKANGIGNYTIADLAIVEGKGDGTGFVGGWGMVIIYENDLMKYRDVTLFDGHALVVSNGDQFGEIFVDGFKTVPSGPVKMKLGVMASEGDAGVTGDYLKIRNNTLTNAATPTAASNYTSLSHSGNTTTNFFNSSIFTGGNPRNPNIVNNTGVDLSMFEINNPGNSVLGNNQTSTTFRYGTVGELYAIFGLAMSVETYVPEPEAFMGVTSIDGNTNPPLPYTVTPGKNITYTLNIKNKGTEAINSTVIRIPISNTINFEVGSITITKATDVTTTNLPYFDTATSTIIWDMGTLPLHTDPNDLLATLTFRVKATENCAIIINNSCTSVISVSGTIAGVGVISGNAISKAIFKGFDNSTGCNTAITTPTTVALNSTGSSCFTNIAGADRILSCGGEIVTLAATTGTTGTWTIVSGPTGGGEIFSSISSPSSTFSSPNFGQYLLRWTTGCAATTDDVLITFVPCNVLNFDGVDDHVTFNKNYSLNTGAFSIEVWIKSNASNTNRQTIFSKRLGTNTTHGYDLRLVNNIISFNWNNSSITSQYPINTGRWYHVAVTFNGTNYKLYIDGIAVQTQVSGVNPVLNNNSNSLLGATGQTAGTPSNFFNGWMDELRIWKLELTPQQIRQMMNQEITNSSGNIEGSIVPLAVPGLNWSNLDGYYQMNKATDILNGNVLGKSLTAIQGRLINIGTPQPETAPLPYTTAANTAWETSSTWTNGSVWNIPNTLAIDGSTYIDWNIVKTSNKVTTAGNKTLLGLLVESNTLEANSNNKIEVTHYLKINGKIDLVGKSQLIQTEGSILETSSSGSIERDQLGQSNKYNYNYWSSPVSPISSAQNNGNYSVSGVMKDGSTTIPQNINWTGGYDGAPTTPFSIARYWLYKFDSLNNAYANWTQIAETAPLRVGQGFTMKGSGSALGNQTYTFVGKPNNGTIATNTVGSDQLLLAGNPYPSALDADAFITDNINSIKSFNSPSIDGTLYFWEHYATNNTHILRAYQGGYAVRNLTGGIAPSSSGVDFITQSGTPSRGIPNRFIPVGQGFFVIGKLGSGGTVTFKNSQRGFYKEDDAANSNVLYKTKKTAKQDWKTNENDSAITETYKKLRLGFNSHDDFHRQVLLGFMDEKATSDIDPGYDGFNIDDFPNDMYFLNGDNQLLIQGEGYFDEKASYAIGIKTDAEGKVSFNLDLVENFDTAQRYFIYDKLTDTYNDITTTPFEVTLSQGKTEDRFFLKFNDGKTLNSNEFINESEAITIRYAENQNSIIVNNPTEIEIKGITLYNILGQNIINTKITNQDQKEITIPLKKLAPGIYITKVQTDKAAIARKIIIQ